MRNAHNAVLAAATDHRLLAYIEDYYRSHGYAPSYRECAAAIDRSWSTMNHSLKRLERAGYIVRRFKGERTIVPAQERALQRQAAPGVLAHAA